MSLFRPRVRWLGDTLYICDTGNNRALIVDSTLTVIATVGGEGSGPGELMGPADIQSRSGVVGVLDAGNLRINRYGADGRYLGDLRLPYYVRSFALLDSARVVLPDKSGGFAFAVVDSMGGIQRFGSRPPASDSVSPLYPDARNRMTGMAFDLVAVSGQTVFVADNLTGAIGAYDLTGNLRETLSPPASFVMGAFTARREFDRKYWHGLNQYSPFYKDLAVLPGQRLMLLTTLGDTAGFVLDLGHRELRFVTSPKGAAGAEARKAESAGVVGDWMLLGGSNGVTGYRIERASRR